MERERQLELDRETLAKVLPGLERLEGQWADARMTIAARNRGYFTPEEDDQVRQMLLAYRNYRLALYDIISRSYGYEELADADLRLRVFLVGFAAALTLYSKSLKLIAAYEREPLVRKKLDEPDAKFELEAGFFEELLRAYSSPWNYQDIARAAWFWRGRRRQVQALIHRQLDWQWLLDIILKERVVVRQRLTHVLLCRLRYDWRSFVRTALQPVQRTRYSLRSLIGTAGANLRTPGEYVAALTPAVAARLYPQLQPGDVLLVRAEGKLTATVLPGFWAHAALYVGSPRELEALGLADHPYVRKHWKELAAHDQGQGCVIEALAPQVRFQSLQNCLSADHVVVARPVLGVEQRAAGVAEAFGHLGKPYDFEFDFNVSTRIVCTELIYRCYHGRGAIAFPLVKRLGRYTLTGDDIATLVANELSRASAASPAPFELIAMALKTGQGEAQFVERQALLSTMQKLQTGWRPAKAAEATA